MADRATNQTDEAIIISLIPDVCLTPMGPSMVPVPYPIIAKFGSAAGVTTKTNFEGKPVFHLGSHLPRVMGDEAGVGGGVKSGVNMGCCKPMDGNHSTTLKTEGKWVLRHGDMMEMNCAGPKGIGNTVGKIVFASVTKNVFVNADGSKTVEESYETEGEDGSKTTGRVQAEYDKDGNLTELSHYQTATDASGHVTSSSVTSEYGADGSITNTDIAMREYDAPVIADNHPDILSDAGVQQAQADIAAAEAEIAGITAEQALDAAQMTLDVAGLADPTPISDGASAAISAGRGDFLGAGLSILSCIPYLGDMVAKPIKGAIAAAKASRIAAKLAKAGDKLKAAKEALEAALKKAKAKILGKVDEGAETAEAAAKSTDGGKIVGRMTKADFLKHVDELGAQGKFATKENEAVFYSGKDQWKDAGAYAKENGLKTISDTPGGEILNNHPDFQALSVPEQNEIWRAASAHYAEGASGTVHVFLKNPNPEGVFRVIEEPILRDKGVNLIIHGG